MGAFLSKSTGKKTIKIVHLNDDCLMKFFEDSNIGNLLNVAIANEWLRPATAEVYIKVDSVEK